MLDPIVDGSVVRNTSTRGCCSSSYVAGALADFADDLPAAMIVASSHARTGLARVALGSVTMAVLHQATCPLLVDARLECVCDVSAADIWRER